MSDQQTTDTQKLKYLHAYIHYRTGVNIHYIQPPRNQEENILMNHMFHRAKIYMASIGKELTVKD